MAAALVPNRYLFKFEFPLHRTDGPPFDVEAPLRWNPLHRLPPLHTIDGEPGFGELFAAWNDDGLFVATRVTGKRRPLNCDPDRFRQSDNLRLMTDTRDTRTIRRATRFCQQFYFLPTGGGSNRKQPVGGGAPVARAQSDAPVAKPADLLVAARVDRDGYVLSAHVPARVLAGFDPAVNKRLGFFVIVEDTELGRQSLTVDDDLNWWCDPSTWPTAVLTT